MKSDIERGPFGAWARKARIAKGWASADKAVGPIADLTGHRMRADYLRGIESGAQVPGPDTVATLEMAYESVAPPVKREAIADPDLAAAIREQTGVLQRLVDLMERQQEDAPVWAQAVVSAVLAGRQLRSGDAEHGERSASGAPQRDRV